ncbi:LexA family protein [Lactobacillus terrae]|uniref:LexA family protein n=1 Tax=Lactobacillus terrae TaxID=2269374 RepID=UPI000C1B7988|nr:XRE family transcriptional regulator [Lactobacillus terrae]
MKNNEERRKIIAANIRKYLSQNNMSQTDLSEKIGISKSTLSDYINLRSAPSYGVIQKIADTFNVNKSDIDSTFKNSEEIKSIVSGKYNYFDAGISAGTLQTVDPFTSNEVETIDLPDVIMGRYANDPSIFITRINGESMNRVLPNGSLIAVKKFKTLLDLKDGDIVIFQDGGDLSVKRFYNDTKGQILTFMPDSTESDFVPINYRYESADKVNIIGKVVIYTVEL